MFYTSLTLHGPNQEQVLACLHDRNALVSATQNTNTTVLDEVCEDQNPEDLAQLAARLSTQFACPVLSVLNHDDDTLYWTLHEDGLKTDEYNSNPDAFSDSGDMGPPHGGDAVRLCRAFGSGQKDAVEQVLRETEFMMASERHARLARALGLPDYAVAAGFHIASDEDSPLAQAGDYRATVS